MGEVKVFGIHKGRTPIDKSIWRTGLSYSRVATVTMPTLSGAMVVLRGFSNATEQDKAKAAIRRTIVKSLVLHAESRVGSRGKQNLV